MSDLLADAAEWLRGQRKLYMSQTVIYAQDGSTYSLTATKAETRFETDTGDGVLLSGRQVDWLIDAADLVTGFGVGAQPEAGDRIQAGTGATAKQYTVVQLGGEPVWRWHDRQNKTYRIHTVESKAGAF
tara:strand:+ start:235 stop:621 length:387 start_codon:yes stop_codon:yes gene_type:complete